MFARVLVVAACFGFAAAQTVTLQAESAALSGVTIATAVPGYTGSGYVEGFSDATDKITFTVNATQSKLYDLNLIYSGPYGDKQTLVVLNGAGGSPISLPATTKWTTVSAGQVLLKAGTNTIEIQSNWGWYFIDAITLAPSAARGPHKIDPTPINPNATADTKALLKYLNSVYGKNILSGQQDQASLEWVEQNLKITPAILGLDLMDYTQGRIDRGASSTDIEKAIAFAQRGGIVTFAWHWNAPAGLYDSESKPWWAAFRSDHSDFNLATALKDTTNANYTLLMKDIDTIAIQLKRLQDAEVTVLWRPLHEAEGKWFWWGAQGPEPCKQLWHIMYERLTVKHGLNNLVWVWNSVAPDWYPGNDAVDMVSADTYAEGDHGPLSATYNNLLTLTGDTKIVAAAEIGSIMMPEQLKAYQADWVYFLIWSGEYISGGKWNSLELLTQVYNDPYVLNLEDIKGWRNGSAA